MKHWQRKGLFYYASVIFVKYDGSRLTVERRLDFLSYHLIRFIHGDEGLRDMAVKYPSKK